MVPKYKSSDSGNSDMSKRSCKPFPLHEKVKVLNKKRKKKNAKVAKIYSKNKSIRWTAKKGKEICASFPVTPQTAKVTNTVHFKNLGKTEKSLNVWVKDTNRNVSDWRQ